MLVNWVSKGDTWVLSVLPIEHMNRPSLELGGHIPLRIWCSPRGGMYFYFVCILYALSPVLTQMFQCVHELEASWSHTQVGQLVKRNLVTAALTLFFQLLLLLERCKSAANNYRQSGFKATANHRNWLRFWETQHWSGCRKDRSLRFFTDHCERCMLRFVKQTPDLKQTGFLKIVDRETLPNIS
jgi:hypothetical protein